ncbi:unnamed protein product, partial [Cuscuta epithymum]
MGKKRNKSELEGLGKVTEYEKQRMKILASNEEKMRAAGFSTLANKTIFQSNNVISTNRPAYSHDVSDDEAYSPSDDENAELDHLKVPKKGKGLSNKTRKQSRAELMTMGDVVKQSSKHQNQQTPATLQAKKNKL